MKTNLIIFTIILIVSAVSQTLAQQPTIDKTSPPGLSVKMENLTCLKSLQCIQKNNLFVKSNFDILKNSNNRIEGYALEGSSENEELVAHYNNSGTLIQSIVIHRNIPLPREIRIQLVNDDLKSWNMIGNERVIKNFDKKSIEYKLILKKEDEIRIVYFDHKGQNKNLLS